MEPILGVSHRVYSGRITFEICMNSNAILIKIFGADIISAFLATTGIIEINIREICLMKCFIEPVSTFFVSSHQLKHTISAHRIIVIIVIIFVDIRNDISIEIYDIVSLLKPDRINKVR